MNPDAIPVLDSEIKELQHLKAYKDLLIDAGDKLMQAIRSQTKFYKKSKHDDRLMRAGRSIALEVQEVENKITLLKSRRR